MMYVMRFIHDKCRKYYLLPRVAIDEIYKLLLSGKEHLIKYTLKKYCMYKVTIPPNRKSSFSNMIIRALKQNVQISTKHLSLSYHKAILCIRDYKSSKYTYFDVSTTDWRKYL